MNSFVANGNILMKYSKDRQAQDSWYNKLELSSAKLINLGYKLDGYLVFAVKDSQSLK